MSDVMFGIDVSKGVTKEVAFEHDIQEDTVYVQHNKSGKIPIVKSDKSSELESVREQKVSRLPKPDSIVRESIDVNAKLKSNNRELGE